MAAALLITGFIAIDFLSPSRMKESPPSVLFWLLTVFLLQNTTVF
jgi:hypothetical protein